MKFPLRPLSFAFKTFLASAAVLFLMLAARPRVPPPPQVAAQSQTAGDQDLRELLLALQGGAPAPAVECPKLPPGQRCVPLVRFTDQAVTEASVERVEGELQSANDAGAGAIVLELATPGGSVGAGQEFARAIERSHAPVYCVVDGVTASMGFYVLQSCRGRYMTKRSSLMMHEPSIESGDGGKQEEYENSRRALHAISEGMLEEESARMKISQEEAGRRIAGGQDWWQDWREALEVGSVDAVVESVESAQQQLRQRRTPRGAR